MPSRIDSNPVVSFLEAAFDPQTRSSPAKPTDGVSAWVGAAAGALDSGLACFGQAMKPNEKEQLSGLASLLSSIFQFVESLGHQDQSAPRSSSSSQAGVTTSQRSDARSFDYGVRDGVSARASYHGNGIDAQGSADASVYAQAHGQGDVTVGPDGVDARGSFEAHAGATAGVEGSVNTAYASAEGQARATVDAYVRADGEAKLNASGADVTVGGEAGASARSNASGHLETHLIPGLDAEAQGAAWAEAGTGAHAKGEAVLTFNPPQALVRGEAGAFAGARAGVHAEAGIGPVKANYGVEARTGIGADAHWEAGIKGNKLKIDFGIGAALGIGLGFDLKLEIDIKPIQDIFNFIGGLFGGGKGDGSHATKKVSEFTDKATQALAQNVRQGTTGTETTTSSSDGDSWATSGSDSWSGGGVTYEKPVQVPFRPSDETK